MSELLTVADAAKVLTCSPRTVERMIAEGELLSVKIRRLRRVARGECERFLERDAARRGRVG